MRNIFCLFFGFVLWVSPLQGLLAGVGTADITPPLGSPSAGYAGRERIMTGVHDPLIARALLIDNGKKRVAFCGVDHLGFDHSMVEEIRKKIPGVDLFVGSSHTHSGAGGYLDIPVIGELLAGPFQKGIRQMLIDKTVEAIHLAENALQSAEIGFGYGKAPSLSYYRRLWPQDALSSDDLTLIKVVSENGKPLAALFNYAVHPTVLGAQNTLFSADFVGYARERIEQITGAPAIYFNGAQAEINPKPPEGEDEFDQCCSLGNALGDAVIHLWEQTLTDGKCSVAIVDRRYCFDVKPVSSGLNLPFQSYQSEFHLIVFNRRHAFVTVPGELSAIYAKELKEVSYFPHLSFLGLTNDAHGYILRPEAFEHHLPETEFSFGGPYYGEWLIRQLLLILQ